MQVLHAKSNLKSHFAKLAVLQLDPGSVKQVVSNQSLHRATRHYHGNELMRDR